MAINGDLFSRPDKTTTIADHLIRRLAARYLLVLTAIAGLIVIDQAVIQPLLIRLSCYAPAINVAGRQRMLSQKLAKSALAMQSTMDAQQRGVYRTELRDTLEEWSTASATLRFGRKGLMTPMLQSSEIAHEWKILAPHFDAMRAAADKLIRPGDALDHDRSAIALASIVDHESAFLTSMDRIVTLMEKQSAAAVFRLRVGAAAIAASIIALLLLLGGFVVRPATHAIRSQVDHLEIQVALRTRELSAALASLRHEIAERTEAESKTIRLAAQLAHAGRVTTMGHFTAGLAHELNQPLATIANYAEACDVELARSPQVIQSERFRSYVNLIKQSAHRAGQIIRRMRNFVRPNASSTVEADVGELIQEVVELCRTETEHADVELSLELAAEPAFAFVDPIQIQQVLVNLVQNALQAMHNCAVEQRRLRIRTFVSLDLVQVEVTDTGPGFGATDSESLFAPFYTTKLDGLGIGLAICRSIIEQHSGTIWAESAPGHGATMTFTLPLVEKYVGSRREQAECVCR